jgi:ferric-dicitrate binding protein FerR (iron transport regulator)
MSTEKRIWTLISKKLSGEAGAEELKELEDLLRQHPDMHYPMQHVADLWHHRAPVDTNAAEAFDRHAQRMRTVGIDFAANKESAGEIPDADLNSHPSRKRKRFLVVAMAGVAALAGYFFLHTAAPPGAPAPKTPADRSEVSTRYGSKTKLVLPDGTQVWLNSGSRLTYDKTYGNTLREVQLTGEAYFDVVKNAGRPFIIHAPGFNVKVLGTAFNVRSFPGEKKSETSLIKGSVEVTFSDRPTEKIILKPNEKLVIDNEEMPGVKTAAVKVQRAGLPQEPIVAVTHLTYVPADSTLIETSWMDNKLIFRSEPFADLAVRMERWFGVSIRFANEELKEKKFTGIFENETIEQALKALQYSSTYKFRYTINRKEIILK